jgi:hypothetical protein
MGERRSSECRCPYDIGAEEPVPRVWVQLFDAAEGADATGVDDAIDAAELFNCLGDSGPARGRICDIADDGPGVVSRLCCGVDEEVMPSCHQRDLCAPLG